jgi:hypothetical protein
MNKEKLKENCCTPEGQIKRYIDCKGCDRKPKQETLEEFAKRIANDSKHSGIKLDYQDGIYYGIEIGAKEQAKRMYSEEEVLIILDKFLTSMIKGEKTGLLNQWFEQFKKKD